MEEINVEVKQNGKSRNKVWILVAVTFIVIFLIILIAVLPGNSYNYLCYENYSKISNGMSYSQVVDILDGHSGEEYLSSGSGNYRLSYYSWQNGSGTKCIIVGFENGQVCAKSQYGLI